MRQVVDREVEVSHDYIVQLSELSGNTRFTQAELEQS
jgi:hypothetical protein